MVALRTPTVAFVGNPNTGKTTLFNALAGMNQRVGNYAGVTVETKKGKLRVGDLPFDIIDLPGTYSLAPRSPDEMLAVDVILGHNPTEPRPDVVVTIVDASNLERNLYLMTQVAELGVPVVIALNMVDVATAQGLKIDVDRLSQQLGVPVVPLQANRGIGLEALKTAIAAAFESRPSARSPAFPERFDEEVAKLQAFTGSEEPTYLLRRLVLDVDGYAEKRLGDKYGPDLIDKMTAARQRLVQAGFTLAGIEARVRYGWIHKVTTDCIQRPAQRPVAWTDRIDKVLTHRVWGTLIFLVVMFLVFESIFVAAAPFMDWIKAGVAWVSESIGGLLSPGPLRSLLVEGIIKGVGAVIVFLPQIVFLFAIIAFLEDCGYMARAAFLMDRLMSRAGLNGKSFIPLLSSMACAVPGIMSARVIENRRDRLATILVAPLMSCSARLPVYSLLISAFLPIAVYGWWVPGLVFFGLYMLGIIVAPLMAFLLKQTLLRGETPVFVMEMPLYKMPSLATVLRRAFDSGWMFLKRAGTLILATMILVWAALYFPSGNYEEEIAQLEQPLEQPREQLKTLKSELKALQDADAKDAAAIAAKQALVDEAKETLVPHEKQINDLRSQWKAQSVLGRMGQWIEPAVKPLGWDWRIGMAAIASFPAREVMVGTLGIIFGEGEGDAGDEEYRDSVGQSLRNSGAFTVPVAMSVLVFFALCSQCVSTLVIIKRETGAWRWPIFTFVYMTALAYIGAFVTYQVGSLF
ncbi:MAG: ferrous iron transport protein B [Gemmataceae bacterium]|nr:ferrous iron transport protein B [Gemmataceae bacterium]